MPSYSKVELGSFLFMIKLPFLKDQAMPPPVTLTTKDSGLYVQMVLRMAIMSLFPEVM